MPPAEKHLSQDPVLGVLIAKHHLHSLDRSPNLYLDLVNIVIGQQLSVKAAQAITQRLYNLLNLTSPSNLVPQDLLRLTPDQLSRAGLSRHKTAYLHRLSQAVVSNHIILDQLRFASDHEVFRQITSLKGFGPWSADMFLIFSLRRPDIFSVHDLGLRTAVARLYCLDREDRNAIQSLALRWSPYRSLASRYLWASLDNTPKST